MRADTLVHCVYILFSHKDEQLYVGFSSALQQRLATHDSGDVPSTAPRRPLTPIHVEYYLAEADARRREQYFKTTKGKRTLKLMLQDTLTLIRQTA